MNTKLNKLITDLSRSIGQRRLYFADHPLMRDISAQIVADLKSLLTVLKSESLFIGIVDGKLVHDGHFLVGPSIMGQQLVEFANKLHCGGLVIGIETTVHEMQSLLDLAGETQSSIENIQEARKILESKDVQNIELASHYLEPSGVLHQDDRVVWQGKDSGGSHLHSPLLVYQALFDVVAKAHGNVSLDRSVDVNATQAVSEHLLLSTRANYEDMLQFVHYPDYDSFTVGHSVRVATLAVFVGNSFGLSDEQLLDLGTAGLLHDIGKSKVPSEILFKQEKLSQDEFEIIKSHAGRSAEILLDNKDSTMLQVSASWGHHIRYDGGGYPKLPHWAVRSHLVAFLQICDVFEALTAVRPYKAGFSPLTAYGIMLGDKGGFDPSLLQAFISTLGIYPPGNSVRLSDGTKGMVIAAGSAIDRPIVRITHDKIGDQIGADRQQIVDLTKQTNRKLAVAELIVGNN